MGGKKEGFLYKTKISPKEKGATTEAVTPHTMKHYFFRSNFG